ncbi:MAG: hypothetical protein PF689_11370 [Deltaproteobacteria bacterium]|jgi:hypothetical protein|nr:hypothetical protein [Deltaproteobacteria bacterium]
MKVNNEKKSNLHLGAPAKSYKKRKGFGNVLKKTRQALGTGLSFAGAMVGSPMLAVASSKLAGVGGETNSTSDIAQLQKQNQDFNLDFLKLQMQIQGENRRFSTLSNVEKSKHDTAKSVINNIRS